MNWRSITAFTWLVLAVAIVVPAAQARQDPIGIELFGQFPGGIQVNGGFIPKDLFGGQQR